MTLIEVLFLAPAATCVAVGISYYATLLVIALRFWRQAYLEGKNDE